MTNNDIGKLQPVSEIEEVAVEAIIIPEASQPIDLPSESLTPLDESYHDALVMEVQAEPEDRIVRLPASDIHTFENTKDDKHGKMGKYGFTQNDWWVAEENVIPSHTSVTLLNAKHRDRIFLWQRPNRNQRQVQEQYHQHTPKPSFDPMGLSLKALSNGDLAVASLDKTSASLPWAASLVSVGDVLVSINHATVNGMTPVAARNKFYDALLLAPTPFCTLPGRNPINVESGMTTTLVFAKPQGSPSHVATTVEKPSASTKLGFKFACSVVERSLRVTEIPRSSALAPACLVHAGDTIVSINGQSVVSLWDSTIPEGETLAQVALGVLMASPRYVTLMAEKGSDVAVALASSGSSAAPLSSLPAMVSLWWFHSSDLSQ